MMYVALVESLNEMLLYASQMGYSRAIISVEIPVLKQGSFKLCLSG